MTTISYILFSLYVTLFLVAVVQETTFAMVFSLVMAFLIACFLVISLGFEFLGYLILIVYVGAIAVLFLFMVMLFDRAEYKLFGITRTNFRINRFDIFLIALYFGTVMTTLLLFGLGFSSFSFCSLTFNSVCETVVSNVAYMTPAKFDDLQIAFLEHMPQQYSLLESQLLKPTTMEITKLSTNRTVSNIQILSDIELLGLNLYNNYFIAVLLAGLGLLVSMIGCILVTKSPVIKRRSKRTQVISEQLSRFKI